MHLDTFLLDTNIISHTQKERPDPVLVAWIRGQTKLAIPFPVIVELERGVTEAFANGSRKAPQLRRWLDELLQTDLEYPMMTPIVARHLGAMYACPALQNLWYVEPNSRKRKPGQDLYIAATAIAYGLPIATLDTSDYVLIDKYFPLPGIYHPVKGRWSTRFTSLKDPIAVPTLPEGLHLPWSDFTHSKHRSRQKLSSTTFILTRRQ